MYLHNMTVIRTNKFDSTPDINMGNHPPIKQAPKRVPLAKCEEMESMKEPGITKPSSSLWILSVTIMPKKDGNFLERPRRNNTNNRVIMHQNLL